MSLFVPKSVEFIFKLCKYKSVKIKNYQCCQPCSDSLFIFTKKHNIRKDRSRNARHSLIHFILSLHILPYVRVFTFKIPFLVNYNICKELQFNQGKEKRSFFNCISFVLLKQKSNDVYLFSKQCKAC